MAAADLRPDVQERLTSAAVARARQLAALKAYGASVDETRLAAVSGLVERCEAELAETEAALARAAQGSYGQCVECGAQIGTLRLQHLPLAQTCLSCTTGFDADYAAGVRVRHVGLLALVHAIAGVLRETDTAGGCALAMQLLADLRDDLREHFALEEMGGYLSEIVSKAPRLTRRTQQLEKQHSVLAHCTEELVACAAHGVSAPEAWLEVERRFDALRAELMAHEAAENDLIREALMGDIGRGD